MSAKGKSAAKRLTFENFYSLIDALMLFGAEITCRNAKQCSLRISRTKQAWPAVAWAVIVAESQDPQFDFLAFKADAVKYDRLLLRTRDTIFLAGAYERWYSTGKCVIPENIVLDEKLLTFWLVGSMSSFDGRPRWTEGRRLVLGGPKPRSNNVAEQVYSHLGVPAMVNEDGRLYISAANMPKVLKWLNNLVPQRAFLLI